MAVLKRCSGCHKPLGKQYLKVSEGLFHPACFLCHTCQQTISGEYVSKKGLLYHPKCYRQRKGLRCDHCQHLLDKNWTQFQGKNLHPECYKKYYQPTCALCQHLIESEYTTDSDGAYHLRCYENHKGERCDACSQPLRGKYLHDIWGHKVHAQHGGVKTLQCHVCARLISETTSQGGLQYADARVVCGICRISEITQPVEIEQAKRFVLQVLSQVGLLIPDYISVLLSDKKTLNKRLGVSLRANSHGYTRTLERQQDQQTPSLEHSIYILFGLPRLMFYAVLAHELIHVWLNERHLHHWSKKEIEGFCNLGSALIYQGDESPLAEVLLNRLETDPDPVYGDGYRLMVKRLRHKGWAGLIQEMQEQKPLHRLNKFVDRFL